MLTSAAILAWSVASDKLLMRSGPQHIIFIEGPQYAKYCNNLPGALRATSCS